MTLSENHLSQIQVLCKTHSIKTLYLFGSAARGMMTSSSDVDLLYEWDMAVLKQLEEEKDLDAFILYHNLREQLEILLHKKVDLVPLQEIDNPYFLSAIEKDKKLLYAT